MSFEFYLKDLLLAKLKHKFRHVKFCLLEFPDVFEAALAFASQSLQRIRKAIYADVLNRILKCH